LSVLPRISKVWNDSRYTPSRRAAKGVYQNKQFHQISVCGGRTGRLYDEAVGTSYVLSNRYLDFTVAEAVHVSQTHIYTQVFSYIVCQLRI
jgi:hypothetical protein